jgi:hypothetical protein
MASTKYKSVDDYIEIGTATQQKLADALRKILVTNMPYVQERVAFNIPFYSLHGMLCYWHYHKQGIRLCVNHGKELAFAFTYLQLNGRKLFAEVYVENTKDFKELSLVQLINTLYEIMQEKQQQKKLKVAKKKI